MMPRVAFKLGEQACIDGLTRPHAYPKVREMKPHHWDNKICCLHLAEEENFTKLEDWNDGWFSKYYEINEKGTLYKDRKIQ